MNLSNKHVRFIDNGLFVDFARLVAKSFGKATYCMPWQSYCAKTRQLLPGDGFDEMERVKYPLKDADSVDLWVFLDIYHSDMQCFLEDHGARVFGARNGEEMELHRWEFKQLLKKLNLPVQHCEQIWGVDNLRKLLKGVKNKYVKTSFVRGDFETFRHDDYVLSEPVLDELAHHLSAIKDDYEFIVEDEIPDAVEVGYDGFTVDGMFPSHAMMAYEVKDVGMIGTAKKYEDLAAPVKLVNSKLAGELNSYGYRGFLCTEIRYTKDKKPFLIDPCCRLGTPSNELLQELFEGWPETIWNAAEGKLVSPRVKSKFGVLAVIHSEWGVENFQALHYPRELDSQVKLRFHCKIGGVDYTVPQPVGLPAPGCVVGTGETLLEAVNACKEHADQVKGHGVCVSLDSISEALDVIAEGEKFGIKFTNQKLPTAEELQA